MEVKILQEAGYDHAIRGMAYSYYDNSGCPDAWWDESRMQKAIKRSALLCGKGGGHDKFLRQIMCWIDINAPRYWWSEFDTYQHIVRQSTSTMHTLKSGVTPEHFEGAYIGDTMVDWLNQQIAENKSDIAHIKSILPEAFLQRRLVTINYGSLWTIFQQRCDHRLPQWRYFIDAIREQAEHPELLWSSGD